MRECGRHVACESCSVGIEYDFVIMNCVERESENASGNQTW
jgi:hypothetical protein